MGRWYRPRPHGAKHPGIRPYLDGVASGPYHTRALCPGVPRSGRPGEHVSVRGGMPCAAAWRQRLPMTVAAPAPAAGQSGQMATSPPARSPIICPTMR